MIDLYKKAKISFAAILVQNEKKRITALWIDLCYPDAMRRPDF